MTKRSLPYSLDAEKGALGAMILNPSRVVPIAQRMGMQPEVFHLKQHQNTCRAIYEMGEERLERIDVLTLSEVMKVKGWLKNDVGQRYLDELIDSTVAEAHAEYYLDIVRQKHILRRTISISQELVEECRSVERGDTLLQTVADRYLGIMPDIDKCETNRDRMNRSISMWEAAKRGEELAIGLDTPWELLTEILCGLETGITILAGRPSQGKTTIEDQIAVLNASQGIPVGRITLDSTADELLDRAMCRKAGVSLPKLKFGYAGESQLQKCRDARDVLSDYPLYFEDKVRELRGICATARSWKMRHDIKLLTVDFIQLVEVSDMGRSQWDKNACVSYASKTLKALALELEIPILVLSQLSRAIEKDGREPQLSDLRDSGTLEQDAHKVIFVYKFGKRCKEMEEEKAGATKNLRASWIDVMKNKDGQIGRLPFWMRPHYFMFEPAPEDFLITEEQVEQVEF